MNLKTLLEIRGMKLKEADAIFSKAAGERRDINSAEAQAIGVIHAEVCDLNAKIEARQGQDVLLAKAAADAGGGEQRKRLSPIMGEREAKRYSITRALGLLANAQGLDGLEREVSDEEAKRQGRSTGGIFVPTEVFAGAERRTNQVQVASDGGYLVGQDIATDELIPLLRNQSNVLALGARTLTGLKNDVSIPRVTAGSTAYWLSESGSTTATSATFGQVQMKPRRLSALVKYSKQFLAQSSVSVDQFVTGDIMAGFAVELDRAAINGAGANEPLGILNMASGDRATSVTFGAAATWAKVVSFETNVSTANALGLPGGAYAYLTTPATKGVWKAAAKVANQAFFLWENGDIVNGYAGRATNQFPSSGTLNQVIYGQFSQVLFGEWGGGAEILVNPFTDDATGLVRISVNKLVDIVVRQGKAFAISTDSGAQ